MNRVTGSGIDRLMKCEAAQVLPRSGAESPWSAFGTVMHKFLADCATVGRDEALRQVPLEHFDACDCIELEKLPAARADAFAAEVGFAYDPDTNTAVELGRGLSHDDCVRLMKERGPREIGGVTDVVGVTEEEVIIADYKSGWHDYGDLKGWWQGIFYALCACLVYKRDKARIFLIRVKSDGTSYFASAELNALDLDGAATALLALADQKELNEMRVRAGEHVAPYEGAHCKWCPSFTVCPAKATLATAMAQPEAWAAGVVGPELSLFNAASVLGRVAAAQEVLDRVMASVKELAAVTAIPLENGYVYGAKQTAELEIDVDGALPVLARMFGDEVAMASIETKKTISQAAIKRALGPWVKANNTKLTPAFKDLLTALEDGKASRLVTSTSVRKHKPKEPEGDGGAGEQRGVA